MHKLIPVCLLALTLIVIPALAGVIGSDFDTQPVGPYVGAGTILQGDPSQIQIVPTTGGDPNTPIPPNASGNMLVISGPAIVEFQFFCEPETNKDCVIQYDFGASAWSINDGFGVYIDADGIYDNPDDLWEPLVGFPPSTTWGSNTEHEGSCDGSMHTITFVVWGSTILQIDNMQTRCIDVIPNLDSSWSSVKALYR